MQNIEDIHMNYEDNLKNFFKKASFRSNTNRTTDINFCATIKETKGIKIFMDHREMCRMS